MAEVVSDALRRRLRAAVDTHGLVIWFDPAERYAGFVSAAGAELDGVSIVRFAGSFLELRRAIEPFISPESDSGVWRERAGKVIAYVPTNPDDIHDALCDALACGKKFAPKEPGNLNSGLHVIARQALTGRVPADALETYIKQAEAGLLSLADLDQIGERGIVAGRIGIIFGTNAPNEIALLFLSSTERDSELETRGAVAELAQLLTAMFGLPESEAVAAAELRTQLERHVLTADFVVGLKDLAPPSLSTIELPGRGAGRDAVIALASSWRNRRDVLASYAEAADRVARELGADLIASLPLPALLRTETFRQGELALQARVAEAISGKASSEFQGEARRRTTGFWSSVDPSHLERWRMLADAASVLLLAEDIARELKQRRRTPQELVRSYAERETPWCLIDTHHRVLLRRFHDHAWHDGADPEAQTALERLVAQVRNRHAEVLSDLAESFVAALEQSQYVVPGTLAQADLFAQRLGAAPAERTAYVLVDALRFEMAFDLANSEIAGWRSTIAPAIATFPTITVVGMAALMPGAERGMSLSSKGKQLVVEVGGQDLTGRAIRIEALRRTWPDLVECKLSDLLPAKLSLRKRLESAQHVLVTSQEIDELAETLGGPYARRQMTGVLDDLRGAFRTLSTAGIERIVLTADHGYLFGDDVSEGEKIDAPGGETIELHRRVWIGRGGSAAAGFIRLAASDLGLGGDLEFATPRSTAVFTAAGGATDYFHGGLSLQELVIPVLELTRVEMTPQPKSGKLRWELTAGSKTISTRFFSITIRGGREEQQLELLSETPKPPLTRVELRLGSQHAGKAIASTYGFREASGEVELRADPSNPNQFEPNTVTFQIEDSVTEGVATAVLVDAVTGRELAKLGEIPISIAF